MPNDALNRALHSYHQNITHDSALAWNIYAATIKVGKKIFEGDSTGEVVGIQRTLTWTGGGDGATRRGQRQK